MSDETESCIVSLYFHKNSCQHNITVDCYEIAVYLPNHCKNWRDALPQQHSVFSFIQLAVVTWNVCLWLSMLSNVPVGGSAVLCPPLTDCLWLCVSLFPSKIKHTMLQALSRQIGGVGCGQTHSHIHKTTHKFSTKQNNKWSDDDFANRDIVTMKYWWVCGELLWRYILY